MACRFRRSTASRASSRLKAMVHMASHSSEKRQEKWRHVMENRSSSKRQPEACLSDSLAGQGWTRVSSLSVTPFGHAHRETTLMVRDTKGRPLLLINRFGSVYLSS